MNILAKTIDGIQEVLAICPCCGEIFRLVEGKFIFPQERPKTCEYLELTALERKLSDQADRLDSAEESFEEKLNAQRDRYIELGRKKAKRRLKKIDPVFSAKDIDPQDVKVIFDPVEYLIFCGLNSGHGVELIEFVSRTPHNKRQEKIVQSVDKTIRKGNVDFETLYLKDDGSFDIRQA
jgi:predicted Holliday junction resolvase-like endonuclease